MNFYKPDHKYNFYTYKNKYAIQSYWLLDKNIYNKLIDNFFNKDDLKLESNFYSIINNDIYLNNEYEYGFRYEYSGALDLCLNYSKEFLSNIISYDRFQELILRDFKYI